MWRFTIATEACALCGLCSRCGDGFFQSVGVNCYWNGCVPFKLMTRCIKKQFIYFHKTGIQVVCVKNKYKYHSLFVTQKNFGPSPLHSQREFPKCHLCHCYKCICVFCAALQGFQLHSHCTPCQTLLSLDKKGKLRPHFYRKNNRARSAVAARAGDCKCPLDSFLLE